MSTDCLERERVSMNSLAILVLSCDKYADIWDAFFMDFYKKWPNNNYPVYLLSNNKIYEGYGVRSICVGEDVTWSANLKAALSKIEEKNILTVFDDLFITEGIRIKRIDEMIRVFQEENMNYLRLNPLPPPTGEKYKAIGVVRKGELYRSSAVFSIWKKQVLLDILDEKENAWQFEITGSTRTDKYDKWYSCLDTLFPYLNLIIKGKYDPRVYHVLKEQGIELPDSRELMSRRELYIYIFKEYRSRIFQSMIPWNMRRKIRQMFNSFENAGK